MEYTRDIVIRVNHTNLPSSENMLTRLDSYHRNRKSASKFCQRTGHNGSLLFRAILYASTSIRAKPRFSTLIISNLWITATT